VKRATEEAAVPVVKVVSPSPGAPTQEILLPGTTQAFTDAPIWARTNGYLKRWYFDIGARVKEGQLLAEIESPEIDQQLMQARADLETARANLRQADITAARWLDLLKTDSVSKQETDQAVSALHATRDSIWMPFAAPPKVDSREETSVTEPGMSQPSASPEASPRGSPPAATAP
jgi:multidrug efflux pump subunit AcrA (membrane-fusion protein)